MRNFFSAERGPGQGSPRGFWKCHWPTCACPAEKPSGPCDMPDAICDYGDNECTRCLHYGGILQGPIKYWVEAECDALLW